MFHQTTLPTMEEAISAMVQEEVRLRVMVGSSNPVRSVYVADNRECYNCGRTGHLSYECYAPPSGGRGRATRGGGRGGRGEGHGGRGGDHGGRGGRGRGRVSTRAYAVAGETSHIMLTGEQAAQWEKWQKSHTSESSQGSDTIPQADHFGNYANYAQVGKGE